MINLDPGADNKLPYTCNIDIRDLITITDVQDQYQLGPNGSILYCIEYLQHNIQWLIDRIKQCIQQLYSNSKSPIYMIIDMPGQIELYTHHSSIHSIIHNKYMNDELNGIQYTCIHMIDSMNISDIYKYISCILLSLNAMIQLELPHINVLTKIDLLYKHQLHKQLLAQLNMYTDVIDIHTLLQAHLSQQNNNNIGSTMSRYTKLTNAICDLIDDYSLVSFMTLDVSDKRSMLKLLKQADKSNGYVFIDELDATNNADITHAMLNSVSTSREYNYERNNAYMDDDDDSDVINSDDEAMIRAEQFAQAKAAERTAQEGKS